MTLDVGEGERQYVLHERVSQKYLVRMTGIGPMLGTLQEAQRFTTEQEARQSPAMWHALTVFEVAHA